MPNELAWAYTNPHLFVPAAVIESNDRKTLTLAAFDVDRPNNQRKYQRNRVIAAFHHELNLELLVWREFDKISLSELMGVNSWKRVLADVRQDQEQGGYRRKTWP